MKWGRRLCFSSSEKTQYITIFIKNHIFLFLMPLKKQYEDLDWRVHKALDKIVHRNEDGFERHARQVKERRIYGGKILNILCPFYSPYRFIKYTIMNPEFSTKSKIVQCAAAVVIDVPAELIRGGLYYLIYRSLSG